MRINELIVEIGVPEEGNAGLRIIAGAVDEIARAIELRDVEEGRAGLEDEGLSRHRAADTTGLRFGECRQLRNVRSGNLGEIAKRCGQTTTGGKRAIAGHIGERTIDREQGAACGHAVQGRQRIAGGRGRRHRCLSGDRTGGRRIVDRGIVEVEGASRLDDAGRAADDRRTRHDRRAVSDIARRIGRAIGIVSRAGALSIAGQRRGSIEDNTLVGERRTLEGRIAIRFNPAIGIGEVGGINGEIATGPNDGFWGERGGELVLINRLAEIAGRIPGIGGAGIRTATNDLVDDEIPRRIVRIKHRGAVAILRHSRQDPIIDWPDFSRPVRGSPRPSMVAGAVGKGGFRPEQWLVILPRRRIDTGVKLEHILVAGFQIGEWLAGDVWIKHERADDTA